MMCTDKSLIVNTAIFDLKKKNRQFLFHVTLRAFGMGHKYSKMGVSDRGLLKT